MWTAQYRANPTPADAAGLASQLRQRKLDLQRLRIDLAARARGELGAGSEAGVATAARVRGIDRELAQTETALDNLYELLRPGAERQKDRRTRAACLAIAEDRIATVKAIILSSGIKGIDKRVKDVKVKFNPDSTAGKVTVTVVPVKPS